MLDRSTGTLRAEGTAPALPVLASRRRGFPRAHTYTAFVLSGGGARGALQVGALRALLEHGEYPDLIVGTSIGAWNGAWLARNPTLQGVDDLEAIWRSLSTTRVLLGRDRLPGTRGQALTGILLLTAARRMARGAASLYGNEGMRRLLDRHIGDLRFEDLVLPFSVVATDLTRGERAIFRSGPLWPCLLASSAIPGVFPPVAIGDGVYCDGGALDPCSIDLALKLGARRIFILAIGHNTEADGGAYWADLASQLVTPRDARSPATTVSTVLERAGQVQGHYLLERALERVPRGIETHVLSLLMGDRYGVLDFSSPGEWIDHSYAATREYLRAHMPPRISPSGSSSDDDQFATAS